MFMDRKGSAIPEYTTYPRTLEKYRWFKPVLTAILSVVFWFILQMVIFAAAYAASGSQAGFGEFMSNAGGGYDDMDVYSVAGILMSMGLIAAYIPALLFAMLITRERPVKTLFSSRGGWSNKLYFRCLGIGFIVSVLPQFIMTVATQGFDLDIKYTVPSFIVFLIFWPLQCIGEEFVVRGFIMQTVGSWTRSPIVAVIVSVIAFVLPHPYNATGRISVAVMGLLLALLAWYTFGLEAACGLHVANNFAAFFFTGIGIDKIKADVSIASMLTGLVIGVIYVAIIVFINRKYHWFDKA